MDLFQRRLGASPVEQVILAILVTAVLVLVVAFVAQEALGAFACFEQTLEEPATLC